MEKTVLEQKETYVDSVHRWGRIWGLGLMLLILAYPITVSLIFHAQVNWPAFIKGFIAIGPMYWAVGIVEIFTYVPMLGAGGSYLGFIPGSLSMLKVPCTLAALDRAQASTSVRGLKLPLGLNSSVVPMASPMARPSRQPRLRSCCLSISSPLLSHLGMACRL